MGVLSRSLACWEVRTIDSRPRSVSKGLQLEDLAQARLDHVNTPESPRLCTCVLQLLYMLYSCLYPSLQPVCGGSRPWTPPLPAHWFPRHLCSSMGVLSRSLAYCEVGTIDSRPRLASKGLQVNGVTRAQLDRIMAQERFPYVRACYHYCTRFAHACIPARSPRVAAIGVVQSWTPPHRFPCCTCPSMDVLSRSSAY